MSYSVRGWLGFHLRKSELSVDVNMFLNLIEFSLVLCHRKFRSAIGATGGLNLDGG